MISKDKFIEQIQSIFEDTPKEEITLNTKFKNLEEWNSLLILSLIVTIEDNFSILVTANQIENSDSFEDLYNTIIIN
jgi:acyl carrier protein